MQTAQWAPGTEASEPGNVRREPCDVKQGLLCLMSLEFCAGCTFRRRWNEEGGWAVAGSPSCSGISGDLLTAQEVGRGSPCCPPQLPGRRREKQATHQWFVPDAWSGASRDPAVPSFSHTSLPFFISQVQCPPHPPGSTAHSPPRFSQPLSPACAACTDFPGTGLPVEPLW